MAMRIGCTNQRKNRHWLFSPFWSSPAILTIYLIAILVCIVLLELVKDKSKTPDSQPTSFQPRDHFSNAKNAVLLTTVLRRQDDGLNGDGNDNDDGSSAGIEQGNNGGSDEKDDPDVLQQSGDGTDNDNGQSHEVGDGNEGDDGTSDGTSEEKDDENNTNVKQGDDGENTDDGRTGDDLGTSNSEYGDENNNGEEQGHNFADSNTDDQGDLNQVDGSQQEDNQNEDGNDNDNDNKDGQEEIPGSNQEDNTGNQANPNKDNKDSSQEDAQGNADSDVQGDGDEGDQRLDNSNTQENSNSDNGDNNNSGTGDDDGNTDQQDGNHADDGESDSENTEGNNNTIQTATLINAASPTQTAQSEHTALLIFANVFNDQNESIPLASSTKIMPYTVTTSVEFTADYLAIIVCVCFRTLWQFILSNIKLNEPLDQLVQSGDTIATTELSFESIATSLPLDLFKTGFLRNWTSWYLILSYAILLLLVFIPTLASEAFSVQNIKSDCARHPAECVKAGVRKVWTVAIKPVLSLQIALGVLALLVAAVLVICVIRRNSLSLDSVNHESIADVLEDPVTITTMRNKGSHTPVQRSKSALNRLPCVPEQPHRDGRSSTSCVAQSTADPASDTEAEQKQIIAAVDRLLIRFPRLKPYIDVALPLVPTVFLFATIVAYIARSNKHSMLTSWFQSPKFGPKFSLTSVVALLGMGFGRLEYEVRVMTIYRSLYNTNDPKASLARSLLGSHTDQTIAALRHGEWTCTIMSWMGGFGIKALSIVIANVPHHSGQSAVSGIVCILTSLFLLLLICGAILVFLFWRRTIAEEMPRSPTTLAEIHALIARSRVSREEVEEKSGEKWWEKNLSPLGFE